MNKKELIKRHYEAQVSETYQEGHGNAIVTIRACIAELEELDGQYRDGWQATQMYSNSVVHVIILMRIDKLKKEME